jgi:hypothetical protein
MHPSPPTTTIPGMTDRRFDGLHERWDMNEDVFPGALEFQGPAPLTLRSVSGGPSTAHFTLVPRGVTLTSVSANRCADRKDVLGGIVKKEQAIEANNGDIRVWGVPE